jgi:hypothetical protein
VTGDPGALLASALTSVIGPRGATIAAAIVAWLTAICFVCSIIRARWAPPAPGSRWVWLYRCVEVGAVALGYLKPAYQVGRTAAMAPTDKRGDARDAVAIATGIPREETKP